MAAQTTTWPSKNRELQNMLMDSTRWKNFPFRDDDIVIATYPKCGTTWMQQIVSQLVFRGAEGIALDQISPWLEMKFVPPEAIQALEKQTHRRFIKTHLPLDALVFSLRAKYIYVGRDGRDAIWSAHNHATSMSPEFLAMMRAARSEQAPPPPPADDVVQYFRDWLDGRGFNEAGFDFWPHQQEWFNARRLPNILLVHYANLKTDLAGEIRRIANFLEIEIEAELWPKIVEHSSFDYMKKNASTLVPMADAMMKGGAGSFIYKGANGRWRDLLTEQDLAKYERLVTERLTPECAHWLATGEL